MVQDRADSWTRADPVTGWLGGSCRAACGVLTRQVIKPLSVSVSLRRQGGFVAQSPGSWLEEEGC